MDHTKFTYSVTIQRDNNDDGISDFQPYEITAPFFPSVGDVIETVDGNYEVVSRRIIVADDPASEPCEVVIRCREA